MAREGSRPRVLMGLIFYPRGGSAHVARSLARELPACGWDVAIVTGSIGGGGHSDAARFYSGLDVRAVDYAPALASPDPARHDPPMHPSYEERADAPDRVFAAVDDDDYERLVAAWSRALADAGAADADVLHLHHLTPLNAAAERVAADVPVVGHVHGTELLMLEEIERGAQWPHAEVWARRMREWAARCERLILLSESQRDRVERSLGIPPERCTVVANGFDPERFKPHGVDRFAHWRRHLVEQPQGWRPGGEPGSVSYTEEQVARVRDGPVLLYVGRYTAVKRIGLLVRAYAAARERFDRPATLVLLGGFHGEWEGEHPLEAIEACGVGDEVFLAGWHEHDALADFFAASDVVVLPSVREQFGQVLVEGMACGLPAIAANAYGPAEIVEDGRTGWLVEPDDEGSLAGALVEAVDDDAERERRGRAAREVVLERYSWPALAQRVAGVYREVVEARADAGARATR